MRIGNIAVRKNNVKIIFVDKGMELVSVFSSMNFVLVCVENSVQGLQDGLVGIDAENQARSFCVLGLRRAILRRGRTIQGQFDGKGRTAMRKIADTNSAAVLGDNSIADA